jgi:hypothetical protein
MLFKFESCSVLGRFPFNGLTGHTQIVFLCINGKIWPMFLKYLAKMDLIQMLSKFSGQISPKPKCFASIQQFDRSGRVNGKRP